MTQPHPCLSCGACCAFFRVDFSVYQLQSMGGTVPDALAVDVNGSTYRMKGTDHVPLRCIALTGTVGEQVACGIYEWRPNTHAKSLKRGLMVVHVHVRVMG